MKLNRIRLPMALRRLLNTRLGVYASTLATTPVRLLRWAKLHPFESILWGSVFLVVSLVAKPLITICAATSVLGGIYYYFTNN